MTEVPTPSIPSKNTPRWFWPAAGFLLLLGAVLRLVQLHSLPPGLWYDEAIYALDGVQAMTHPRIFYDTCNHMREPLYIWGLGAWFHLFGIGTYQARAFSAFIGMAILATFIPLALRMLDRPGQDRSALHAWALAALAVIVCLRWQVHFSRTIFRAITPTLMLILLTHAYLRFLDTRRIRWAALAGLWLGLGSYTYLSWRLVPLLVLLWILHGLWTKTLSGRRDLAAMGLMGVLSLVVATPLLTDFIQHPEHFRGRTDEVSLFSTTQQRQLPDGTLQQVRIPKPFAQSLSSIAKNALSVALMWNWRGDHVAKHNLPHEPVFDPVTGIVFFIGVGVLLATARQQVVPFVLLTTLAVISLASVLSFGAPNILRTQAMIPAAVLTVIFGLRWITDRWTLHHPKSSRILIPVIAVYLALFGAWQVWTYFGLMPRSIAVRQEFQTDNFYLPAVAVQKLSQSGQVRGRIWVPEELANHPTFAFASHGTQNMVTYPAQGWPTGQLEAGGTSPATIAKGDAVLLTLRSIELAYPRNLRAELRAAGTNRRIATIPIFQANGPPIPFAELTLIE